MGSRVRHSVVVGLLVLTTVVAVATSSEHADAAVDDDDRLTVLSIGDSFIAGTGNGDYYPGQGPGDSSGPRVPGPGRNCYQSYSSYPWQYTEMLDDAGYPADIWHAACHGAQTHDLEAQFTTIPGEHQARADILLISAGGNDAKFSNLVTHCLLGLPGWLPGVAPGTCDGDIDHATAEMPKILDRLFVVTEQLLSGSATYAKLPNDTQIVFVGYPVLNSPKCPNARVDTELDQLQARHDDGLVSLTRALAAKHGDRFHAVLPSSRFRGKGPCARDGWMHGPSATVDISFHPNAVGANQYADLIFDQEIHTRLESVAGGGVPATSGVVSVVPGRVLESRVGRSTVDGVAEGSGRRGAGSVTQVPVVGRAGVPGGVDAVVLNVAAVEASGRGFATVWPCGEQRPVASTLNFIPGGTVANGVLAKVGASGMVCVYTSAETDLIADVTGYTS